MFARIEKHLKERVNDVVFINLKDEKSLDVKGYIIDDSIPLPLPLNEVVNRVKNEAEIKDISIAKVIQGMVYIIGVDSDFKYNKTYREFLKVFDENIIKVVLQQGFDLIEANNKIDALICFKACLYIDRNDLDALYNYGRCLEEIAKEWTSDTVKDFEEEAREVFEELVESYPDFPLSYYHLGFYYANKRLYKKASITWEKYLDLSIDKNKEAEIMNSLSEISHKIQFEEGYNLVLDGRANEALDKLLPLEKKYPEWWNLQFFVGLAYRQLQNFEEGLKHFDKAYIIKPSQADILNEMGLCNISLGKNDEAIKYFKKALNIKENDAEILCNLGIAYMQNDELELAQEHINRSLKANPKDEITKAWLKKINSML